MTTIELEAEKAMLARELLNIDNIEILKKVRKLLHREIKKENEVEYISKEELLEGIRQGLVDVKEARRTGKKQKTLQEVIDEL